MSLFSRIITTVLVFFVFTIEISAAQPFITTEKNSDVLILKEKSVNLSIFTNAGIDAGIMKAVKNLQSDFQKVTGNQPNILNQISGNNTPLIIIGTVGTKSVIDDLIKQKKIDGKALTGKNEKFIIQNISNPIPGVSEAIVIAGSDKRGTIYGIYEMSQQIGVSPWYYMADVPVKVKENIYFRKGIYTDGEPAVKYRGIFLNDEEPSLGGWARATFGGINSKFYEKVFELILRMKGNYIWPAMWGKAFYDDDALSGPLANEMGIIMGTSHHEPMAQARKTGTDILKKIIYQMFGIILKMPKFCKNSGNLVLKEVKIGKNW